MRLDAQTEIAQMLDVWAASVRAHDLEGAVRGRSADIVMFDVPAPLQAKGIDAYRDTWRLYFRDPGSRRFALEETHIAVGGDIAWVRALLRCTTDDGPAGRLTMGLRRVGGRWVVEHEHHSFPVPSASPGQAAGRTVQEEDHDADDQDHRAHLAGRGHPGAGRAG